MKTYYGNYLGIVVSGGEKDPEGRGRCQVFVPHIMPALYEGWNREGEDLSFDIVGDGLPSSLSPKIVDTLKKTLPWAECAAPIVGASPSVKNGSEAIRNTGGTSTKEGLSISDLENRFSGNELAFLTSAAAKEEAGRNRCGEGVFKIATNAFGLKGISGANGQDWGKNFETAKFNDKPAFQKIPVSSPEAAPPNSFLVYLSDDRLGKPRTLNSKGLPTGGSRYGHVEYKGINTSGQTQYLFGQSATTPGGTVKDNFTGFAYVPIPELTQNAFNIMGRPDINPSGLTGDVGINMAQPGQEQNDYNVSASDPSQLQGAQIENNKIKPELLVKGAQGTRYGFVGDPFANEDGRDRRVGNANNPVHTGMVAISPELRQQYGLANGDVIALKQGDKVTYGTIGNSTARNLPTTGGGPAGRRVDFLDLNNNMDYVNGLGDLYLISRAPDRTGPNGKGIEGVEATSYSIEQYNKTISLAQNNLIDFENASVANTELIAKTVSEQQIIKHPTSDPRNDGPDTNYQALGMFGYASEGTAVWVFFREGNPLFPVYFAASYGQREWQNMYSYSSPGIGAGVGGSVPNTEKMRMNSYGGGFESAQITGGDNTGLDPEFTFQVYGKNGSNLLFTKDHTEFNSTYNHNQRVSGDFHEITEANKETRVRGDKNTFVEQDVYITVGNWTEEAIAASEEIQQYINEAMEIKSNVT